MYVIIGATSFIGVYTIQEFIKHGEKIVVTARNDKFRKYYEQFDNVEYINFDLNNPDDINKLPKENVDGVILISALLPATEDADLSDTENADKYIITNTLGTINILEYCRKNKIKRLISTVSYADIKNSLKRDVAITEDEPRNFDYFGDHSVYVISKNAASDIMEYYNQQHNMKNAWFRLPPVYGVGPHGSLKVNGKIVKSGLQIFMDKAEAGEPIVVYGKKDFSRDVVYVKDVAQAYYKAIKSGNTYGLYNISAGHGTTLFEQADVISKVFAKNNNISKIEFDETKTNAGKEFLLSIEKAKKDFDYNPQYVPFEKMMLDYKAELEEGTISELFSSREV